jgi:N-acetylglucosaminyl-diphospho-decaprenol L-rhamnosyltransferase
MGRDRADIGGRVAAIVVFHDRRDELIACVDALHDAGVSEVVVVDNTDDQAPGRLSGLDAVVVSKGRNVGYGAGANHGIRQVDRSCDGVLVVNPDVRVDRECLASLLSHLGEPQVGAVAPRLTLLDGSTQASARAFPSPLGDLCRRTPLGRTRWGSEVVRRYLAPSERTSAGPVDWVVGACILLRPAAGDAINWFDERFYLYFEDVDLCARLWSAGWKVIYAPDATAQHAHARASAGPFLLTRQQRHHVASALKYYSRRRPAALRA